MDLQRKIENVRAGIDEAARAAGRDPASVTLLAATKTKSSDTIRAAIAAGITVCGENRVQELTAHLADNAYEGAEIHFIGHLQTNKVKYVVGKVALIHSVSSEKLLLAIGAQAEKLGIVQDILLEINLAGEESKSGFSPQEAVEAAQKAASLPHVRLRGLMCIPPASTRSVENLRYFESLRQLAVDIRREMVDNMIDMDVLSMGMSGDYQDAVAAGSTCIRVGSALFGPRPPVSPQQN
ncbi:MAG: YggS family pyridoxal phosphate-dependent enzyme [Oscillospiraceae bacterium]|nr:YggS family pyridoxal phosphate-dependent enzyme [Oscillospiraceae bacterium]